MLSLVKQVAELHFVSGAALHEKFIIPLANLEHSMCSALDLDYGLESYQADKG